MTLPQKQSSRDTSHIISHIPSFKYANLSIWSGGGGAEVAEPILSKALPILENHNFHLSLFPMPQTMIDLPQSLDLVHSKVWFASYCWLHMLRDPAALDYVEEVVPICSSSAETLRKESRTGWFKTPQTLPPDFFPFRLVSAPPCPQTRHVSDDEKELWIIWRCLQEMGEYHLK